jgi:hypothetical protein
VDFVLAQYVKQGVDELDAEKLSPLLKLKYNNALADASQGPGEPEQIRQVFVGFQRYLYVVEAPQDISGQTHRISALPVSVNRIYKIVHQSLNPEVLWRNIRPHSH